MLKTFGAGLHRLVARGPRWLAGAYLAVVSLACRWLLPAAAATRIQNSIVGERWPPLALRPRRVTLGRGVQVRLIPHLEEFDAAALFTRRPRYEQAVFQWLETHAGDYDLVVDIGANVGIYAVFLDALARRPGARLQQIAAFEPSQTAFARLAANLAANGGAPSVAAYNAAVADRSGFLTFFETEGHLTNGTLVADFARAFSDAPTATRVLAVTADDLDALIPPAGKVLIKMDVEGYEAALLTTLRPVLARRRPDLVVEVLPGAEAGIERALCGLGYRRCLLADAGPAPHDQLVASPTHRDWLFQPD